jgi:hypothetical protein
MHRNVKYRKEALTETWAFLFGWSRMVINRRLSLAPGFSPGKKKSIIKIISVIIVPGLKAGASDAL